MNQEAGAGLMGLRYLHPVVLHAGAQARCVLGGGGWAGEPAAGPTMGQPPQASESSFLMSLSTHNHDQWTQWPRLQERVIFTQNFPPGYRWAALPVAQTFHHSFSFQTRHRCHSSSDPSPSVDTVGHETGRPSLAPCTPARHTLMGMQLGT